MARVLVGLVDDVQNGRFQRLRQLPACVRTLVVTVTAKLVVRLLEGCRASLGSPVQETPGLDIARHHSTHLCILAAMGLVGCTLAAMILLANILRVCDTAGLPLLLLKTRHAVIGCI
jgi:hypothetical protein